MKTQSVLLAATLALVGTGAGLSLALDPPSPTILMMACMERNRELVPAIRAEACGCVASTLSTRTAAIRNWLQLGGISYNEVTSNVCLAKSFGELATVPTETRMSPMPTVRR